MQSTQEALDQAARWMRSGEAGKAAETLALLIKREPANADAWCLLAGCAPDGKKQRFCLERSLSLNPDQPGLKRLAERMERGESLAPHDFVPAQLASGEEAPAGMSKLECMACGGPLQVLEGAERCTCAYCGQEYHFRAQAGSLEPVLKKLQVVEQGINQVAESLALRRIGDDLGHLQQDAEVNRRNFTLGGQFLLPALIILGIYFFVLTFTPFLFLGTALAVAGLFFLVSGKIKSSKIKASIRGKQEEASRLRAGS